MASDQDEVVAFLRSTVAWENQPAAVDVIETHGAIVFLAGEEVLKIKRAVKLPYFDFSTLEARRRFCAREIEINHGHAPGIYRGVVAIARAPDGGLTIGGDGEPVEWAVRMWRFKEEDVLLCRVRHGGISREIAEELADTIAGYHAAAPMVPGATDRSEAIAASVTAPVLGHASADYADLARRFAEAISMQLARSAGVRGSRVEAGCIRRCHGDLHLNNLVLWRGHPVPFDAIEFDEAMATIDPLYDLAFLLMDLERNGARATANIVLNRYLWRTGSLIDLSGLAALPLFLGLRAGIRAMIAQDRARLGVENGPALRAHVVETLQHALRDLTPPAPRIIAIGGLSGTGKSTLAASVAPLIGAVPGAVHLRTDMERKRIAGVEPLQRLPPSAYTASASLEVYDRILERAGTTLAAGHSVIVDAVFANPKERAAIEAVAGRAGVQFLGLWLEGDRATLEQRVAARSSDASDATVEIVRKQLEYQLGQIGWHRLNAARPSSDVLADAKKIVCGGA